jgi:hypothetical protein
MMVIEWPSDVVLVFILIVRLSWWVKRRVMVLVVAEMSSFGTVDVRASGPDVTVGDRLGDWDT